MLGSCNCNKQTAAGRHGEQAWVWIAKRRLQVHIHNLTQARCSAANCLSCRTLALYWHQLLQLQPPTHHGQQHLKTTKDEVEAPLGHRCPTRCDAVYKRMQAVATNHRVGHRYPHQNGELKRQQDCLALALAWWWVSRRQCTQDGMSGERQTLCGVGSQRRIANMQIRQNTRTSQLVAYRYSPNTYSASWSYLSSRLMPPLWSRSGTSCMRTSNMYVYQLCLCVVAAHQQWQEASRVFFLDVRVGRLLPVQLAAASIARAHVVACLTIPSSPHLTQMEKTRNRMPPAQPRCDSAAGRPSTCTRSGQHTKESGEWKVCKDSRTPTAAVCRMQLQGV